MAADIKCYTVADVKTNVCWALCRHDGYDTGSYEVKSDSCVCGEKREYKEFTKAAIKILPSPQADETVHIFLRD